MSNSSTGFVLHWKRRVTRSNRMLLVLGRSEAPSEGTGFSSSESWPTPRTEGFDAGGHRDTDDSLPHAVKHWATPTASIPEMRTYKRTPNQVKGGQEYLQVQAIESSGTGALIPGPRWRRHTSTPTTQDAKNNGSPSQQQRDNLNSEVGGSLNPAWVELLQGLSGDWTDLSGLPGEERDSLNTSIRAWRKAQRIAKNG